MLMESIGNKHLHHRTNTAMSNLILESIQLTYISQGKGYISFQTEINDSKIVETKKSSIDLNIRAINDKKMVVSQGFLRYK